jgi:D-glycero-alpha-D-manno-heptose-7-phosphate kinase
MTNERLRIINSVAPIRICDNGGWTDTWFAEHGKIFNIGVYPYAEAQVEIFAHDAAHQRIIIEAENFGDRYELEPDRKGWNKHPLLEAAIEYMHVPKEYSFRVSLYSEAPAGASTGTSAAVTVALIAALDRITPGQRTAHEIAYAAHYIETSMLGLQCGIQDQLCSAFGGIIFIEMHKFPHAAVSPIQPPNAVWWELERRLALIYLGSPHSSSEIHKKVIGELEDGGPECKKLQDLRMTAGRSRDAVYAGNFADLGQAMTDNTDAQERLHPDLVSTDMLRIIEIARAHHCLGWKVNGAGGDGGSMTLLCSDRSSEKRAMLRTIEDENPKFKNIPIYLSRYGVRTWEHTTH